MYWRVAPSFCVFGHVTYKDESVAKRGSFLRLVGDLIVG
jgi:hypothetical protein